MCEKKIDRIMREPFTPPFRGSISINSISRPLPWCAQIERCVNEHQPTGNETWTLQRVARRKKWGRGIAHTPSLNISRSSAAAPAATRWSVSYVLAGRCPITGGNFSGLQGAKICRRRAAERCLATFTEVEIDTRGLPRRWGRPFGWNWNPCLG